jgi:hypothetical protein
MVFSPAGRERFSSYPEALEAAERNGRDLVMEYMKHSGLDGGELKVEVTRNDLVIHEGGMPLETRLTVVGVSVPRIALRPD